LPLYEKVKLILDDMLDLIKTETVEFNPYMTDESDSEDGDKPEKIMKIGKVRDRFGAR
jgi:hypothetical protein